MSTRYAWLGHSAARLDIDGTVIYIDPVDLREKKSPPADLVLLTNPREGHTSPEDVNVISAGETRYAGPADALAKLDRAGRVLQPGESFGLGNVKIRAVSAGTARTRFFPLENGWLGYLIETSDGTVYHSGMTEVLPELETLHADVAFLPISGRYAMSAEEACKLADQMGARVRLPLLVVGDRYERVPGFTTAPGRF